MTEREQYDAWRKTKIDGYDAWDAWQAATRDAPSADAKREFAFAALSEAASICDAVAERFSEEPRAQYAADLAAQEIRILSEQWKAIAASAPKGDGNE